MNPTTLKSFLKEAASQLIFFVIDGAEDECYLVFGFSSVKDVREAIADVISTKYPKNDHDDVSDRYEVHGSSAMASEDFRRQIEDLKFHAFNAEELADHVENEI